MTKITKFPSALISGDCTTSSLRLDGGSIIDQCIVTAGERGTFFLEQHLLYVVMGGSVKLTCGRQSWTVGKNEMILLRKAHSVSYEKHGSPETGLFESQLFAINDELLKDFLTSQQVNIPSMTEEYGAQVSSMSDRLVAYCWSLAPYFNGLNGFIYGEFGGTEVRGYEGTRIDSSRRTGRANYSRTPAPPHPRTPELSHKCSPRRMSFRGQPSTTEKWTRQSSRLTLPYIHIFLF